MIVLIAHGSRDRSWRRSLERLAEAVSAELEPEPVRLAFLQFAGPTLEEVVAGAAAEGHERLKLLPLFMASAGHVEKDVHPLVESLAAKHGSISLELMEPVGENALLPELLVRMIRREPPSSALPRSPAET